VFVTLWFSNCPGSFKETCCQNLQGHESIQCSKNTSSKGVGMPPEVTSRSRDVHKHGGGVIDLINMQMIYLICK